ncbi:Protein of unknown function (DUF3602) [Teratosphaeria destructans]|uniref:Uncharacterized protein n=1 Tax=Teratosphaeria destructans TaxID=418781 RepID=A0A9W7SZ05_9PEZI|nr:Protein of unknown function (DUF3602) [Teratosphaeria destructans]
MPLGRGGVGNIEAVEHNIARMSADLEASHPDQETPSRRFVQETQSNREQQYAHTGRGGSGNYYSPQELRSKGHFTDAHRSHILGDGTRPPAESADAHDAGSEPPSYIMAQSTAQSPRKIGRGGAGNISFGVTEDEERAARKRLEQQEHQEKLKAEIEKGVHDSLAMPPPVKLAAAGHPL